MSYDFNMEMKLLEEAPHLHRIFSDNVLCCQNMLVKYKSLFPNYTDHTVLHSLEVIAFCNELIGDEIDKLNTDEIFVLLMAAYLHDSGMGVTLSDFEQFSREFPAIEEFRSKNPDIDVAEVIRDFHNEISGLYIKKYASLFDFPSEEHLFATIQASRGHRKTDLYDEAEYPGELRLDNGNVIHTPYLAALIRLADELDIAADRNIQFLYSIDSFTSDRGRIEFKKHQAIKALNFKEDYLEIQMDFSDPELTDELHELIEKLNDTLNSCVKLIKARTPFEVKQTKIKLKAV